MDYLKIIINGYNETHEQRTPFVSYFKREAQKAKRDDFCEYVDFFNGCKNAVRNIKRNIEGQCRKDRQENQFMIDYINKELATKGFVEYANKTVTGINEINKDLKIWESQRDCVDIKNYYYKDGNKDFFERANDPQFTYVESTEIESAIQQAEIELNNKTSGNNMKNERELAELLFDKFRETNCKTNEIVMMRSIRFGVIDKLNPKEKEIFCTILNGLIFTGYYTYQEDSPECIRLTEKGYDYIYDDDKIEIMKQKPWIIPEVEKTDWDRAYNKLWKVIGSQDTAIHYIGGSQFYKFVYELCDDIPPSYSNYIEQRKGKELSTSRMNYYKDLIDHLDEEKRFQLYVNIQIFIEDNLVETIEQTDELDLNSIGNTSVEKITRNIVVEEHKDHTTGKQENDNNDTPTVFISYSWDNKEHEDWVVKLATKLRENGVDAILDKWDLDKLGKPLPNFMEQSISKAQRVICIMTPNYKKKTEKSEGGVGYEYSIITAEIFTDDVNTSKFIPLFRNGTNQDAIPTALNGRKYVDMRNNTEFEDKFMHELLRDIFDKPKYKKPEIGKKPTFD
jgi:hypothetical protein